MSKDYNDSDEKFTDTIPSVSLKKDGIASTQDVLDVMSYLEKKKKLDSYQAVVHYLNTTEIEALDDHLKEMGLKFIGNNGCHFEPRLFVHICKIKSSDNPTIVRPHADKNGAGVKIPTPAVCDATARKEMCSWRCGSKDRDAT